MTKPDKTRQIAAVEPIRRPLSIEQLNAVDLLVTGQNDREVAEAVGVCRPTICGWRLHDPFFQAALNRRRADLWGGGIDRLRNLIPRALDCLEREVDTNPSAALALLKLALDKLGAPTGPTDAVEILDAVAKARRGPSVLDTLLAQDTGNGPVTDDERREALAEMDARRRELDGEATS